MKPNILFINSITIYGGGEVWMITAMKEFLKRNYNVTLITRNDAALIPHAESEGIEVIPLNISGDINPFTIIRLYGIFKRRNINVVIANTGKDLRLSGFAALFKKSIKIIARQGIDYPLKNNLRYRIAYNYFADKIVANSGATKSTMLKNAPWLNPDSIKVIYNGIDPIDYKKEKTKTLRKEFNLPSDMILVGFVGRLSVQKGVIYALEAFKSVSDKHSGVRMLICGEGELRADIEKFISVNDLKDKVILTGFRKDIPNIMRTIDILLTPSLWEGFGIVLIEAMASGKPCVATNTSSIPEIIEDGFTGFLVPPQDSESLSEALMKVVSDPGLLRKMGEAGINVVNQKFTIDKMIKEYESLF